MKNKLFIASAGAGKTTLLVQEAIKCKESVLITTFTEENEREIRKKIIKLNNGAVPAHVTIRTWFSFLIEHGAKPYQGKLTDKNINGLLLVNEKSGLKYKGKNHPVYYKEDEVEKHYFSNDFRIYSDKLSKFVFRCDEESNGFLIERMSALFNNIFIDEVQDMAGHDLEIIKKLFKTKSNIKIAGDPRQVTYHTHFPSKYKKYSDGKIQEFVENECKSLKCFIDTETLKASRRNNKIICDFANSLFPELPQCETLQRNTTEHDGIFLVREKDINEYLKEYSPMQLRYSRAKKVSALNDVKNFGESKGSTFDRVLIYPTQAISDWLLKNKEFKSFEVKCKFYVAVTRAKYSVGIVCNNNIKESPIPIFNE